MATKLPLLSNQERHHLFDHINIDPRNTFLPDGMADDVDGECKHYERMIQGVGGIDLQLLGIGRAGHIGFNEPDWKAYR